MSCKFMCTYFMKASFPTPGLVAHPFQESAILKLLKLVACPHCDYDTVSYGKTAWVREKSHEYCNPGFKVI